MGFFNNIKMGKWQKENEANYSLSLELIADETKSFIERINKNPIVNKLANHINQCGTPYSFTVSTWGIEWQYCRGGEVSNLYFRDWGLPDLQECRPFSSNVVNCVNKVWMAIDGNNELYCDRFKKDIQFRSEFMPSHTGLHGISSYVVREDVNYRDDENPCIDERVVLGVVLCWHLNEEYTYNYDRHKVSVEFTKKFTPTASW